ncbi:MAG: hypothetical protein V2I43_20465, partial [Parvularcula sp.]|nr:hypothetical protein [Parvularcula sp.]
MRCRGDGIIDMSVLVTRIGESWEGLQKKTDYELHISAYGRTGSHVLPVRVVEIYPSHELIARVDGSVSTDGPLLRWMEATSNLSYQLRQDGEVMRENGGFVSLTGGIDLSTFGSNVGPLIEHCRENASPPEASERDVVTADVPAPQNAPKESSQDSDAYLRALENCMVLPSQRCIHRLAGLEGSGGNGVAGNDTDNLAAYLAAYDGPAEAVLDATLKRYPDKPDVALLTAGSILAEVGRTNEALSVLDGLCCAKDVKRGPPLSLNALMP